MLARIFVRSRRQDAWAEGTQVVEDCEEAPLEESQPGETGAPSPPASQPRRASRNRRIRPDAVLVTTLESGGRSESYVVSDEQVTRVESIPQELTQAISFTELDYRIATAKRLYGSAPQSLIVRELGQPNFRVVNGSRTLRAVYAAESARLEDFPIPLASGPMALDLLEKAREVDRAVPRVTGFRLGDAERGACLLILYAADGRGTLSVPTVVPDSSDIASSIRSFIHTNYCQQLQIDVEAHQPILFSASDLLDVVGELENYPAEPSILGIPERRFFGGIAGLTWSAAAASVALCISIMLMERMVERSTEAIREDTSRVRADTNRLLTQNLRYFARSSGLDVSRLLDVAEQLWRPGATVAVKADGAAQSFAVRIPIAVSSAGERTATPDGPDAQTLTELLRWPPPRGVLMTGLATTGESNAFTVQYALAPAASAGARIAAR